MDHVVVVQFVLEVRAELAKLATVHAEAISEELVDVVGDGVAIVIVDSRFLLHALSFISRGKNQTVILYEGINGQQPFV